MCAVLVVPGDLVRIQGAWCEVRASRLERFMTGGAVIVLTLAERPPLRVPVFLRLAVARGERGARQPAPPPTAAPSAQVGAEGA